MKVAAKQESTGPRIYVACLSSYNAGRLHGVWIDASEDVDEMQELVDKMLEASPSRSPEEFQIHDSEGFGFDIGENDSLQEVAGWCEVLNHDDSEAMVAYASNFHHMTADEVLGKFLDGAYLGKWESLEDYARDYVENAGLLNRMPESLQMYFDYESYARDLEMGGDVFTIPVGSLVYVFDNYV